MTWSHRRQLTYLLSIILFFAIVGGVIYFIKKPAPTCFDGKQNQAETGIDCGGPCAIVCPSSVIPLIVYWARPLEVADGLYDVAALVENQNQGLGVRTLKYGIKLYDENNVLLAERSGSTFVNPGEKLVIFESRITTSKTYPATQAFIEFEHNPVWVKASPIPKVISIERKEFTSASTSALHLVVKNNSIDDYRNIKIYTVLADSNENVFAASATFIDDLKGGEKKDAYLTWPTVFSASPSFVDSYWRVDGLNH